MRLVGIVAPPWRRLAVPPFRRNDNHPKIFHCLDMSKPCRLLIELDGLHCILWQTTHALFVAIAQLHQSAWVLLVGSSLIVLYGKCLIVVVVVVVVVVVILVVVS